MPRYFFAVIYSEQAEIRDRMGTPLRDDAKAIEVARRVFDEFRANHQPKEPEATIIVRDEEGEVVYRFPNN